MPDYTNIIDIDLSEAVNYKVEAHKSLHMWDQGVKLHFTGATIPSNATCQFDAKSTTYNMTVDISTSTCEVPNVALGSEFNGDLKAHLYAETTEYGIVIFDIHVPVVRRPKPNTYVDENNAQTITDIVESLLPALPTPTLSDVGKFLGVGSEVQWTLLTGGGGGAPPFQPTDAGKVLAVNSAGTDIEWRSEGSVFTIQAGQTVTSDFFEQLCAEVLDPTKRPIVCMQNTGIIPSQSYYMRSSMITVSPYNEVSLSYERRIKVIFSDYYADRDETYSEIDECMQRLAVAFIEKNYNGVIQSTKIRRLIVPFWTEESEYWGEAANYYFTKFDDGDDGINFGWQKGGGMTVELLATKNNYNLQSGDDNIVLAHQYTDYKFLLFCCYENGNNSCIHSILYTGAIIVSNTYPTNLVFTSSSRVNGFRFHYPTDGVTCGFTGSSGTLTKLEIYGIK